MSNRDRTAIWFRRQHGLITGPQALESGCTRDRIRHRVTAGEWARVSPGVFRLRGAPSSFAQSCLAAVLTGGPAAMVSHWSAAALLGVGSGSDLARPISISVPSTIKARAASNAGVVVHRPRVLTPHDKAIVERIPVTKPARLLVDLAATLSKSGLEDLVDDVLYRFTPVSPKGVLDTLDRTRPRHGAGALRAAVAPWLDGPRPGSPPEMSLLRRLVDGGLPPPVRQHEIYSAFDRRFIARPDLAYPAERIAIEYLGPRFHGVRQAPRDEKRRLGLVANGWEQVDAYAADTHPETCEPFVARVGALLTARGSIKGAGCDPLAHDPRGASRLHGDAVEAVSGFHGPLLVADDQELRL
jgi:hypothetical protein